MSFKPDSSLARWAAMFLQAQGESVNPCDVDETGLTAAARALLQSVDDGGVPLFVTSHLKQVAQDNGIDVSAHWTPNEIIHALREKMRQPPTP